jgi:hypothetical protein
MDRAILGWTKRVVFVVGEGERDRCGKQHTPTGRQLEEGRGGLPHHDWRQKEGTTRPVNHSHLSPLAHPLTRLLSPI